MLYDRFHNIKSHFGFTMLELIIVMIVIAIISVIALPTLNISTINAEGQADQLVSDLMYTRVLAQTTGKRYYLIKLSSNTYQIRDSSGTAILYPGTGSQTITLKSGITFSSVTNLPNNLVAFDSKGTPYTDTNSPGTLLAATASFVLTDSGATNSVFITPTTGWIYQQ